MGSVNVGGIHSDFTVNTNDAQNNILRVVGLLKATRTEFFSTADASASSMTTAARSTDTLSGALDRSTARMGGLRAAVLSASLAITSLGLGSMAAGFIQSSAAAEQASISLKVMTGSAAAAKTLIDEIRQYADLTPFDSAKLIDSSKVLMNFGLSAEEVVPTLRMLGDVSAGTGKDIQELSVIFGQIRSTGRLMGQDLLQLINAGFNPLQIMSEQTGKSVAVLKDEMEKGRISFEDVQDAFKAATEEGGLFFNMVDEQSRSFNGRMSTMKDAADRAGRGIGEILLTVISPALDQVSAGVVVLADFIETLGPAGDSFVIIAAGALGAATALASVVQALQFAGVTGRIAGIIDHVNNLTVTVQKTVVTASGGIETVMQRVPSRLANISRAVTAALNPLTLLAATGILITITYLETWKREATEEARERRRSRQAAEIREMSESDRADFEKVLAQMESQIKAASELSDDQRARQQDIVNNLNALSKTYPELIALNNLTLDRGGKQWAEITDRVNHYKQALEDLRAEQEKARAGVENQVRNQVSPAAEKVKMSLSEALEHVARLKEVSSFEFTYTMKADQLSAEQLEMLRRAEETGAISFEVRPTMLQGKGSLPGGEGVEVSVNVRDTTSPAAKKAIEDIKALDRRQIITDFTIRDQSAPTLANAKSSWERGAQELSDAYSDALENISPATAEAFAGSLQNMIGKVTGAIKAITGPIFDYLNQQIDQKRAKLQNVGDWFSTFSQVFMNKLSEQYERDIEAFQRAQDAKVNAHRIAVREMELANDEQYQREKAALRKHYDELAAAERADNERKKAELAEQTRNKEVIQYEHAEMDAELKESLAGIESDYQQALADLDSATTQTKIDNLIALNQQKLIESGLYDAEQWRLMTEEEKRKAYETALQAEATAKQTEIENRYQKQQRDAKKKSALISWGLQIQSAKLGQGVAYAQGVASAITNAAMTFGGTMAALALIPFIGPFLAPIMAGTLSALVFSTGMSAANSSRNVPLPPPPADVFAATGAVVMDGPGTTTSDSISARVSVGEGIVDAERTKRFLAAYDRSSELLNGIGTRSVNVYIQPGAFQGLSRELTGADLQNVADIVSKKIYTDAGKY